MKTWCLLVFYCGCSSLALSQNITGRLVDEQNQPVPYANVILQKADSTYLSGTVTDLTGAFSLSKQMLPD
ncbi:carboxypeptidase-like regulatory domain-containing protein [Bacteroides mediterraneensis]|uniref:carboxypeptidase-like regulatory domain-containing protein n=1 Tax=Bacteroides mediterraneensis TaxID=1841856 RepID=UPI0026F13487|nr:carboxypeptidase-like regulatory domain-containing protein [Bacteroides mediterraneensis]